MGKIKYYLQRVKNMNFGAFGENVRFVAQRSGKSRVRIFFDMLNCSLRYQSGYVDYKRFFFEELNAKQRKTFVTRGVNNGYVKKLNNPAYAYIFDDKLKFNEIFKDFLGREYLDLNKASFEEFEAFAGRHPVFMAKPADGMCGQGIDKIEVKEDTDLKALYEKFKETKQLLLEEYIIQHPEMSRIYPHSVNTLRLVSVRVNGTTYVPYRAFRMGNNGEHVDNFKHGGIYTVLDENGVITKPAVDNEMDVHVYENHPYTGEKLVGFKVPMFEKAVELVKKASELVPEIGYVGWDVCMTEKGPALIEGNQFPGNGLYQSKVHLNEGRTGVKPMFDEIIYGKKKK